MDTKKSKNLKNDFYNWCERNNKQPKSLEEVQDLLVTFITENKEKYPEEYAKIQTALKKTTRALHGAKLNYLKSLKNKCAEDEEVVYYKKGGSVTCGCKKKEQGGEVKKDYGGSAILNFKKMRKGLNGMEAPTERKAATKQPKPQNNQQSQKVKIYWTDLDDKKLDSLVTRKEIQKKALTELGEKDLKSLREKFKKAANKDQYEVDASEQPSKKCGGKVKKHQEGSVINKFKAYRKGGSLNGIPFMQAETTREGLFEKKIQDPLPRVGKFGDGDKLPTARKAEERYANSTFLTTEHPLFSTSMRFNPKAYHEGVLQINPAWNYRPAWIAMEVNGNDTTYRERPEQKMGFNRTVIRQASNSDSDKSEYRTLLRRFNTAKGIAKQPKAKEETRSAPVSFTSFLKHMVPGLR